MSNFREVAKNTPFSHPLRERKLAAASGEAQ